LSCAFVSPGSRDSRAANMNASEIVDLAMCISADEAARYTS
jgi:hypothetical protein